MLGEDHPVGKVNPLGRQLHPAPPIVRIGKEGTQGLGKNRIEVQHRPLSLRHRSCNGNQGHDPLLNGR